MTLNPIAHWNRFWFAPISARPLGMFRVVIGCLALTNLGFLTVDLDYWLTNVGMIQGPEAREIAGPLRPSILQWIQDPASVRIFFAIHALCLVAFTLGWRTRIFGVLVYLGQHAIHQRNVATASGADVLLMVSLFYLMLGPCGAAYSLDARRERKRQGTDADPLISAWCSRLIQIQLTFMYVLTSIYKCAGTTWLTGTALHFVVVNREVGRFDVGWLAAYPMFINLATYAGLAIEFALGFLLWVRAARPLVMMLGIGLHVGICFLVNIPLFGELSMACYLVFLDSSQFETLRRTFDARKWFKPSTKAEPARPYRIDPPHAASVGPHVAAHPDVAPASSDAWAGTADRVD